MKALVVVHYTHTHTHTHTVHTLQCWQSGRAANGEPAFLCLPRASIIGWKLGVYTHALYDRAPSLHFSVLCLLVFLSRLPGHSSVGGHHGNVPPSQSIHHKQGMKRDGPSSSGIPKTVLSCKHIHEWQLKFHLPFASIIRDGKDIPIPLQAWSGPEGSRKLRFPDFMTTAQEGGKVVSLTHRPHLPPGNSPVTHFC